MVLTLNRLVGCRYGDLYGHTIVNNVIGLYEYGCSNGTASDAKLGNTLNMTVMDP
jgi:hypothetical protein